MTNTLRPLDQRSIFYQRYDGLGLRKYVEGIETSGEEVMYYIECRLCRVSKILNMLQLQKEVTENKNAIKKYMISDIYTAECHS